MRTYMYGIKWILFIVGIAFIFVGAIGTTVNLTSINEGSCKLWMTMMGYGGLMIGIECILNVVVKWIIARALVNPRYGTLSRPLSFRQMLDDPPVLHENELFRVAIRWLETNLYPGVKWYLDDRK